jgi:UDP-glucose 4-epimerase
VAYGRSKARAEQVARRWQAAGAPVTIIYPGMVWGPQDPADGESTLLARAMLGRLIPFRIPGAVPIVDVRDLAAVHAAALTRGAGPRRYLAVAARYPLVEVQRVVSRTVGRRLPRPAVPPRAMLAAGRLAQVAQRVLPIRLPFGHEGPWTAIHCPPVDASATIADLGVQFRPPEDTVRDTVHWLTTRLPRSETTGDR